MKTVLIVDDFEGNLYLLQNLMEGSGYRVVTARNGVEALEAARVQPPDLIISDILMPTMDGFAFCRECKRDAQLNPVPFVFYTATYTERKDEELALSLGAARFIVKPLEPGEFIKIISELLATYETGNLPQPSQPLAEDAAYYRLYNEVLIHKLEEKIAQISASESQLRAIFSAMRDLVLIIDHNGIYRKIAPTQPHLLVLPPEELVGRSLRDIFPADTAGEFLAATQAVIASQTPTQIEYQLSIQDRLHWFSATITPANATTSVWVVRDITKAKAAEMENQRLLKESQERLHRMETLHAIELAVTASIDLRLTLNTLLTYILARLKVDAADVLLVNERSQAVEYAAGQGFFTSSVEKAWVRVGEMFAGRAVLERRILSVADLSQEPLEGSFAEFIQDEGFFSYICIPLIAKGEVKGVLEIFQRSSLSLEAEWLAFLETIAGQAAIAIDNARLFEDLEQSNIELTHAYDATIEGWSRAMDLRDRETEGHTQRVVELTLALARRIGVDESLLPHIRRGALLHDMGKMGIPDQILFKSGELTEAEWDYMHKHPRFAYEMLASIEYLKPALEIPYCHHEWWNGAGYPRGLKGSEIPLAARIFSVVDAWDALTSNRPYRAAMTADQALRIIQEESGKHFDPEVVKVFLPLVKN